MKLMVVCESCQNPVDDGRAGEYQNRLICDGCAEKLHPERYNASQFEIIAEAEKMCLARTNSTMASYGVVVVEDDFGDITFFSEKFAELSGEPAAGRATVDYLPKEARLTHREIHRQAIKDSILRQYSFVKDGEQWKAELHPFTVCEETFTLSLFSR